MNAYQLSGLRRLSVIGIPIAFAVLLLFHPAVDGTVYDAIHDHSTRWQIVHVGQLLFIGLLAIAMYLLTDGLHGRLATISRLALLPFVLFYSAFESYTGVGTGELVRQAHDVSPEDQAVASELIQSFWESPIAGNISLFSGLGASSWAVAVLAAALALREAGAPRSVPILFGLAAVAFFVSHAPPFGPIGLVLFAVAALRLPGRFLPLVSPRAGTATPQASVTSSD